MEGYSHLQSMPDSPLTPLTPLSENTKFEFNFGGDGSLDEYINSVRQQHLVQKQQKRLLQQANRTFMKKCPLQPKHYSEEFLKIRDIFEGHEEIQYENDQYKYQNYLSNCQHMRQQPDAYNLSPKVSVDEITCIGDRPSINISCADTPPNFLTPLKPKNFNVQQNLHSKPLYTRPQQKLQQKLIVQQHYQRLQPNRIPVFRQASPIVAKPLSPRVARILQRNGLSKYCGLFQKEEIDLLAFHMLKLQDLHEMGITNQKHCSALLQDIYYARQYF